VCISRTTDTTGAPAGAQLLTNQTSWPTFANGKRYLLRAGQDFTSFGNINLRDKTDIQVGGFGSGAKPILAEVQCDVGNPSSYSGAGCSNIVFMDLNPTRFHSDLGGNHTLLLRCTTEERIRNGHSLIFYFDPVNGVPAGVRNAMQRPVGMFVVECICSNPVGGATTNPIYAGGGFCAFLGNETLESDEHCQRSGAMFKSIIAHNYLHNPNTDGRHFLKLHSGGETGLPPQAWDVLYGNCERLETGYVVVAHNLLGDGADTLSQGVTIGPQSTGGSYAEGLADVIVEDNVFQQSLSQEILLGGRRLTERGNTAVGTLNITTSYNSGGMASGYDGPYHTGGSSIATSDPI
jgi:hypothetical protein